MHDLPPGPLSYEAAVELLFGRINYERTTATPGNFKLERMWSLAEALGHPQRGLPVVHVAGTKGKGSTARCVAEILRAAGYRVGLYTSPHLERIEERIGFDGEICSPSQFADLAQRMLPPIAALDLRLGGSDHGPTYFEILTAMALLHFRLQQADIAVLEVGLGGRLDSTNICEPACCIITSISLDHTKQLGNTLAQIAGEKAGIIKPGIPVVIGRLSPEPEQVIRRIAAAQQAPLIACDEDFQIQQPKGSAHGACFDLQLPPGNRQACIQDLRTALLGEHQVVNAAVAVAACDVLCHHGWRIPHDAMRAGLARARVPARVELVQEDPPVILDTAHNEDSILATMRAIDRAWPTWPKTVIFAATRGKQIRSMLKWIAPWAQRLIFTPYLTNPRSCRTDELLESLPAFPANGPQPEVVVARDPAQAWAIAQQSLTPQLICITGSFFLAGEIRKELAVQSTYGL